MLTESAFHADMLASHRAMVPVKVAPPLYSACANHAASQMAELVQPEASVTQGW
jgi:hypothetical protein